MAIKPAQSNRFALGAIPFPFIRLVHELRFGYRKLQAMA
jgi:hypothetical protein